MGHSEKNLTVFVMNNIELVEEGDYGEILIILWVEVTELLGVLTIPRDTHPPPGTGLRGGWHWSVV